MRERFDQIPRPVLAAASVGAFLVLALLVLALAARSPEPELRAVQQPGASVPTPTLASLASAETSRATLTVNSTLSASWPAAIQQWADLISATSEQYQVDADLLAAIMLVESRGDPVARSNAGAIGLMGVMPLETTVEALEDPETNLAAGTDMLTRYLRQADGELHTALAVYNAGWGSYQIVQTIGYASQVLHDYGSVLSQREDAPDTDTALWSVGVEVYRDKVSAEPLRTSRHVDWNQPRYGEFMVFDGSSTGQPLYVVGYAIPVDPFAGE